MGEAWYDVAQICLNGHVVNSSSRLSPNHNAPFCDECGTRVIDACPNCCTAIRGTYHVPGRLGPSYYSPPKFCHNCGKPYPWTETALKASHQLAEELTDLEPEEKVALCESIDEMVRDTPQSTVAATRFKRLVAKMGKEVAEGFRAILVDIVSEATKKSIWG